MSRSVKYRPQRCPWCHNPMNRGECKDCDPHRHDKAVKRRRGYRKYKQMREPR